ncbi:MAG TPA: glucodextranase DOMON-like domain-containing protein, partial [Rhodothermales bacterium]|nr:glucodextranase DOMON-like domain-containing protein [Rhodothermales bacterium]
YTYPTHPAFVPGILDATGLTIREDDERWYFDLDFRALTQPGWNPQLGFQLTMAALVFGGGGGPATVGREAKYRVEDGLRHVVYVGAGVRVEDAYGNVLGEYRPAAGDERDPLGSPATRRITFSLPKTVLPAMPAGTTVTLLVGGQDDHGGAGLGDFRAVAPQASEWTGGGLPYTGAPNVYDVVQGWME